MNTKKKTKKEKALELQLRDLADIFRSRGLQIRREKLSRGSSFRVKSGTCRFSGDNMIFVDKRLPGDQQLAVMLDYLLELGINPSSDELASLPESFSELLDARAG